MNCRKIKETFESYEVITHHDKISPYQRVKIATVKAPQKIGKCMILDDVVQLCSKDEHKYHELMVHFPIYYLNVFKRALIIGGGDLMNLREIMKYNSLEKVIILELDEDVVKTSDYKDQKTDDKIEIEKIRVSKKLYYSLNVRY